MSWEDAGVAWSMRAVDWAYLMEPLFGPVGDALAASLELDAEADLLDVGCGAGRALQRYAASGASVAGVDAAAGLLDIARTRMPGCDLRQASMTALPWPDGSFSRVTGINSFVYADDGALAEAHRVLRPGGLLGLGFWTDPRDFGWALGALGAALAPYAGANSGHTPLRMADPTTTDRLLANAGFERVRSAEVTGVSEFPDADTAYRALASTGMIFPLVQAGQEAALKAECLSTLNELVTAETGVRMAAQFGWVVARRS